MKKKIPFEIAKHRTPKGEARARERVTMDAMGMLTAIEDEEKFKDALTSLYRIKPGEPRFESALAAWREAQAST
jgi:hypothetical protein